MICRYKMYTFSTGVVAYIFINKDNECPVKGMKGQLIKFSD